MKRSLRQWLGVISRQHPKEIDMGLGRVTKIAERLGVRKPTPLSVIIAGTNGKGSTTRALEALLLAAGVRVGATLSPHILRFNERIRINGRDAEDDAIYAAFARIDEARASTPLTYFEFATLAALYLFKEREVEVALLEVGLGGRLDAFNLVDAQFSAVTSIGLDHQEFLGDDLDGIGAEKAGVFRAAQTAVLGPELPGSVAAAAARLGTQTLTCGIDFSVTQDAQMVQVTTADHARFNITNSSLVASNLALAVQLVELLEAQIPELSVARLPVGQILDDLGVAGRFQLHNALGRCWRLDVGHNPLAARWLLGALRRAHPAARVTAVFAQLKGKQPEAVIEVLRHRVTHWVLTSSQGARAQSAAELAAQLSDQLERPSLGQGISYEMQEDCSAALLRARGHTGPRDVILVFGSFNIVEQALHFFSTPAA